MEDAAATKHDPKPRELSKDSLGWASVDEKQAKNDTSKLFTTDKFSDLGLKGKLAEVIQASPDSGGFGLSTCTAVQAMTLPLFINSSGGKSVLVKSQTGSGKTLTYLLPILHDLLQLKPPVKREDGCRALIIAPTRELCAQISEVVAKLTKCCVQIVGGIIVGGEKKKSEKARLRKGITVLVGTPGRLLDHLRLTESFTLSLLRFIVLDEVDRLLDMGFEQIILEILSLLRGSALPGLKEGAMDKSDKRQQGDNLTQRWQKLNALKVKRCVDPENLSYMMVSATLTAAVRRLAWPILSSPFGDKQQTLMLVDGDNEAACEIKSPHELDACAVYQPKEVDLSQGVVEAPRLSTVPTGLQQFYMLVSAKWRLPALLSFLHLRRKQKVIVFFSTCDGVDLHALLFKQMQWPQGLDAKGAFEGEKTMPVKSKDKAQAAKSKTTAVYKNSGTKQDSAIDPLETEFTGVFGADVPMFRLHGKLPQEARKQTFARFSKASRGILLATDVAARGLDLQTVDWILQYDAPCDTSDYVHRIGRTARRGRQGKAMLFLLPNEGMYITLLASHGMQLSKASSASMLTEAAKDIPGAGKFKNTDEMVAVILQRRAENTIHDNVHLVEAAVQAYRSYVRAYSTHSADAKGIFKVKDVHLGHLSRAFALRDKPSEMASKEDVIAKIFNGDFMSKDSAVRKAREEKERAKLRAEAQKANAEKRALAAEGEDLAEEVADGDASHVEQESIGSGYDIAEGEEMEADEGEGEEGEGDEEETGEEKEEEERHSGRKRKVEANDDESEAEAAEAEVVEEDIADEGEDEEEDPEKKRVAELLRNEVRFQRGVKKAKQREIMQRSLRMQKGQRRSVPKASGKHRSGGGYFKKKLRSEFSA